MSSVVDDEIKNKELSKLEAIETQEWLDSLDHILQQGGPGRVRRLLRQLQIHAQEAGVKLPFTANTPYINTIPAEEQPPFPGSREIERRIKSIIRWNAMAMVVRANRLEEGIGGHISTYASAATLYEIGFNYFFRARTEDQEGDIIYFQGHASPGIYARAFLEGRLSVEQLQNFRNELHPGGGLSSYPHPWLMPNFWEFPTVSMGLSPIMAIYQARFNRYLEDRELKKPSDAKVWAFVGDGEVDEPETLGAITLGSREKLDNLIFVINCNLQRLDGPVRGNGKIIQELEAIFRGAGWNVIKVIWGDDWDPLLAKDHDGILVKVMEENVDGQYQKYIVETGKYIRERFFGADPRLLEMVKHLSDEQLQKLNRGGHDPEKVYAAYKAAVEHKGSPTVILAKTIKGYGLGESGEGKNITHQQKKLNEEELREFRSRFGIPISDEDVSKAPFYKPPDDSPEMKYLHARRRELGGYIPNRMVKCEPIKTPLDELFEEFYKGSDGREVSTTMVYARVLAKLLREKEIGKLIVPIIPDEARTFGMEVLFRRFGIYSHVGQLYEPVDIDTLLYYKEAKDGQILEEGITEAGSMSSFIAAGTAYATHGINTIPFFTFYSMFGLQRIGDLVWAAGDMRCRGFLVGATSGRTTLAGEGLQHQDGHSHLLAYPVPNLKAYDPAFAYEVAVIIQDGIRRMYEEQQDIFYYLTVMNEPYVQPPMPDGVKEGILKGMYKFKASENKNTKLHAHLFGSGAILNETLKAQKLLGEKYDVAADVWSVTSYKELYRDGHEAERWNMLHPSEIPRVPYITQCLQDAPGVFIAASDFSKALPDSIYRWFPKPLVSLGTDGFGRSDSRRALRDFFEVDARFITLAALAALAREKEIKTDVVQHAIKDLEINPGKANPMIS
ncbi:MAG: 2-oxo-acid dehydrogenase E1 subunit, homodimeric type, pyruvate dehydrogenase E1 component [Candidatus Dadabacteria bacterium CSP1-2]|nr:MAG: 2-oxo-acid dehydrogenase E1 subunit, homodimeric type, pyruvate dehydrogenase E1 component [Candidatus Dadabacteria bacterium CSP1-2]OGE23536.1 MAG: pyruvate dehydrogenase (acetyl-transferring), homodimeric type [Candidatus Dadabacteria bacterium RBG_19FT_COMBO_40_33]